VDDVRWDAFNRKRDAIAQEQERLKRTYVQPQDVSRETQELILGKALEHEYSLFELLRRPGVSYGSVLALKPQQSVESRLSDEVIEQVEIAAKYQGYIHRQQEEVERQKGSENKRLDGVDYADVHGLSIEARQKLMTHKPETIGQASRISGITPATISLLLVYIKRKQKLQALSKTDNQAA
jgi:tRNA uridine 5-carboxymethylaminomethyl modification enzyme